MFDEKIMDDELNMKHEEVERIAKYLTDYKGWHRIIDFVPENEIIKSAYELGMIDEDDCSGIDLDDFDDYELREAMQCSTLVASEVIQELALGKSCKDILLEFIDNSGMHVCFNVT